ncbi:MAG TPA: hypothetical protein VM052_03045 [Candidatus Limnocylindrales bacterium]|nr:hypothetical protein [Candidatus Limnocylindrales bacterium]
MDDAPIEIPTDHPCLLASLTERLAASTDVDRPSLAAAALGSMLGSQSFDRCCAPRYRALAPDEGEREVQIPIATAGDIETRVLVWPVGSRDYPHPHTDGWTVFVPVAGELTATTQMGEGSPTVGVLPARKPRTLRPEAGVVHRVRNLAQSVAMSIHVSGKS